MGIDDVVDVLSEISHKMDRVLSLLESLIHLQEELISEVRQLD